MFQDALVDAAEMPHRQVAIVDIGGIAPGRPILLVGQAEDDVGHDRVGQLHTFQNRRGVGREEAAVVGRNAQLVVTLGDGAEDSREARPDGGHGRGLWMTGGALGGDLHAQRLQGEIRVRRGGGWQQVAVLGVEHEQQPVEQHENAMLHRIEIDGAWIGGALGIGLDHRVGQRGKDVVEHDVRQVAGDLPHPILPLRQGQLVKTAAGGVGQEGGAAEEQNKQLQRMGAGGGVIIGIEHQPVDEVHRLLAQRLAQINLEESFGHRRGALPIEPPQSTVGQDAPAQGAASQILHPAQIAQHLGGRNAAVRPAPLVLAVERSFPAFGFHHAKALAVALVMGQPRRRLQTRPVAEQQHVGHVAAALGRQVLLKQRVGPAQDSQNRPDHLRLGLRLRRFAEFGDGGEDVA